MRVFSHIFSGLACMVISVFTFVHFFCYLRFKPETSNPNLSIHITCLDRMFAITHENETINLEFVLR